MLGAWPIELLAGSSTVPRWPRSPTASRPTRSKRAARRSCTRAGSTPTPATKRALEDFVRALLDPQRSATFLDTFARGARSLAATGMVNSLAQAVLKATAPGVPTPIKEPNCGI